MFQRLSSIRSDCNSWLFWFLIFLPITSYSQKPLKVKYTTSGIFSLGIRAPFAFSDSPDGLSVSQGLGCESRIQLGNHYNTEWFVEYMRGKYGDDAVRNDLHIGGSFLLYTQLKLRRVQPFFTAGVAADYSKVLEMSDRSNMAARWSPGVQGGLGMHINVSWRSDITISSQYMFHFGKKIEQIDTGEDVFFVAEGGGTDGHLLLTVSMNFKMVDLWKKIRW